MLKWKKEIVYWPWARLNYLLTKLIRLLSKWAVTDTFYVLCAKISGIPPQKHELQCSRHYEEKIEGLKLWFWCRSRVQYIRSPVFVQNHLGSFLSGWVGTRVVLQHRVHLCNGLKGCAYHLWPTYCTFTPP